MPSEGRFENHTVVKETSLQRVNEIATLDCRHGFSLSGCRSFSRELTEAQIEKVRRKGARSGIVAAGQPG